MNTPAALPSSISKKLEQLEDRVRERFLPEEAETAVRFLRRYYARARPEYLAANEALDLYGAALSHLNLARHRRREETRLRVYNPTLEKDGWECAHTVVEIVIEDMPFLVDSVRMAVNRGNVKILRILHPLLQVRRDPRGQLVEILEGKEADPEKGVHREAFLHLEILRQSEPAQLQALETALRKTLEDVRLAVQDWQPMRETLSRILSELEAQPPQLDREEIAESLAFLRWLLADHFTFLGYRRYDLVGEAGQEQLRIQPESGLGILRKPSEASHSIAFARLSPDLKKQARRPELLVLAKTSARATVHRPTNLDYIGIKRFDAQGRVCGEHRFLGLYGSRAYNCLPQEIPLLRKKLDYVLAKADLEPNSHSLKALTHILETYPRDELFQIEREDLYRISLGILELAEEQHPRLFVREDRYGRFVVCLVFVPRERYDTQGRLRMQQVLQAAFAARAVEFQVNLSEAMLARILFTVRTRAIPPYDTQEIERQLGEVMESWSDHLQSALLEHQGEARGSALFLAYRDAFPAGYREDFPARTAVHDIEQMEQLSPEAELRMSLYTPLEAPPGRLRFKIFRFGRTLPLFQVLPILENMGVEVEDERPYCIEPKGAEPRWIHDFGLAYEGAEIPDWGQVRKRFQDCFLNVWRKRAEDDGFNRLVIRAQLSWRQIALIRALAKYLRQTGMTFSQTYMEEVFSANPVIAALLVEFFEARFDPQRRSQSSQQTTRFLTRLQEALDAVQSLDQDRILRAFLDVCRAILRTNWFQRDATGSPKEVIALKLRPSEIPGLPEPRPAYEIFVYSPRMEGVHLRGGKVARGGLRWSDRREDFRTEVLGLMKAQMVKNAVIVPVGAKGGFVVKRPPAEPESLGEEVRACYRQFISGLLDLTDNLVAGRCQPPPDLVRYDGDDPYLVVAADKGTASFSDLANEVAKSYGFWLGDAFASGGTTGYDHKKMGITARGVWVCVEQHLQAAEIDYPYKPITVVGIGDMSGDVFGNGMLYTDKIKLIAAFDHRHIFIDPDPDPRLSYQERKRLFQLPHSSWADYDRDCLSQGGEIYSRTQKIIRLSEAARAALGCQAETLTPAELIQAILQAPVDLLWNGGIGTYVRARYERDSDLGDRSNDGVRVTADTLRCRVIGEGGNLGLTPLARVELARRGVRLDTDFIQNAGGVICSDLEVNTKILLDQLVAEGELTRKHRDQLLEEMTEEVARLVLRETYWQARAISMDEQWAVPLLREQGRFMRHLEQQGELNRALEFLPDEETLAEREADGEGLTRPEIALLLSYAKHTLYQALVDSELVEDPCLVDELIHYFPKPLRQRFPEAIRTHRLRREILASTLANRLINRTGSTFVFRLQEELDVHALDAVRAYFITWEVFGLRRLWSGIARLDGRVSANLQHQMLGAGVRLIVRSSRWLLKNWSGTLRIQPAIKRYQARVETLAARLMELADDSHRQRMQEIAANFYEEGVPRKLATWVASFDPLSRALDLVEAAESCALEITEVARVYFALDTFLELDWLSQRISALPTHDRWISGARSAYRDDLLEHHRALCVAVLKGGMPRASADAKLEFWRRRYHGVVETWLQLLADLRAQEELDLAMLSVALRALRKLALSTREPH